MTHPLENRPVTLPRPILGLLLASALLVFAPARGQASVAVLDTFGPGETVSPTSSVGVNAGASMAMQFAVPAISDLKVRSITVALPSNTEASQIDLVLDLAGLPSPVVLDSFSVPAVPIVNTRVNLLTVPAITGVTLAAGQRYWLVWRGRVTTLVSPIDWNLPVLSRTDGEAWTGFFGYTWALRLDADTHGACCNSSTGACTLARPNVCTGAGLGFAGLGTVCDPQSCPSPLGACCAGSPVPQCTLQSAGNCSQAAGVFAGIGTLCLPYPPGGPNDCCPADFNNSGSVGVQDIFDFLSGYFGGCP
jgi:hypothetical protein